MSRFRRRDFDIAGIDPEKKFARPRPPAAAPRADPAR